jgi:uncharacterized protein YjbI with pentapeptide repeats
MEGADLAEADLGGSLMTFVDFRGADLSGAYLGQDPSLKKVNANSADFNGANLTNANLSSSIFITASFVGANLTATTMTNTVLLDADLTGAEMTGAINLDTVDWGNTTCPDGTNSDNDLGSCLNHLTP